MTYLSGLKGSTTCLFGSNSLISLCSAARVCNLFEFENSMNRFPGTKSSIIYPSGSEGVQLLVFLSLKEFNVLSVRGLRVQ